MANWVWTVTDDTTGAPVPNAEIDVTISTTPCPKNALGQPVSGCSSGPGYEVQGYTDATGTYRTTIPYTCRQNIIGTIQATGYNAYPQQYGSGAITGDVTFNIALTEASIEGSVKAAANQVGGTPSGQGLGAASTEASQAGVNASTALSTWWSGAFGDIETGGIIVTVALVAIAVIFIVIVIVV